MKRISYFLFALLFAVSAGFVSCSDDDVDPPTIKFLFSGSDNYDNSTNTLTLASGVTSYTLQATITSEASLKSVSVSKKVGATTNQLTAFTSSLKSPYTLSYDVTGITEDCILIVKAINDGSESSLEMNVKVTSAPAADAINTFVDKVLGSLSHTSSAGSSCASIDGTVYTIADAKTNSAKVDFIYFNGTSNKKSLAAPNNSSVGTLGGASSPSTWATKNATKLGLLSGVTAAQFDASTDDALITSNVTTAAVSADIISNLAAGNVVGFITAAGKKGLIKVISIDESSDANQSIKISIKVQKTN